MIPTEQKYVPYSNNNKIRSMSYSTTTTTTPLLQVIYMKVTTSLLLLLLFSITHFQKVDSSSNSDDTHVCLMVYQIADNNLEPYIRQDLQELSQSITITSSKVTTWIYFDGTAQSTIQDFVWGDKGEPLIHSYLNNVFDPTAGLYAESMYLTYNHELQKLVLDTQLEGERNSDAPDTVTNFLIHALQDCISQSSSSSTTEFMLLFSSHGTGFAGYGGDDVTNRKRRRDLLQSNESLSEAIQNALDRVFDEDGAGMKLDVVGFDACLMASFIAVHEYTKVAKYVLGSESTEPGHGWHYRYLSKYKSALDIALNLYYDYLHRPNGLGSSVGGQQQQLHQAPKSLALIDTNAYTRFHTSWEYLSIELSRLSLMLEEDNYDIDFHAFLQRARASSVAFDSALDPSGSEYPSAVDMGSFVSQLYTLCRPRDDSILYTRLMVSIHSYNDMFVARGIGPGTPLGTGMHIMWPLRSVYYNSIQPPSTLGKFDYSLLGKTYIVDHAPHWFHFVNTYLTPKRTSRSGTSKLSQSVCSKSTQIHSEEPTQSNNSGPEETSIELLPQSVSSDPPQTSKPEPNITEEPHTISEPEVNNIDSPQISTQMPQIIISEPEINSDNAIHHITNTKPPQINSEQPSQITNTQPPQLPNSDQQQSSIVNSSTYAPLLVNPTFFDTGTIIQVQTQITPETDYVTVEFGIDLSGLYSRRLLREVHPPSTSKPPYENGTTSTPPIKPSSHHNNNIHRKLRNLLWWLNNTNDQDYFRMYLGTVQPTYKESYAAAIWDRDFLFLGDDTNDRMPVHVYDRGNGARSIPILYFPPSITGGALLTRDDIPIGTTIQDALDLGATFGSLHFGYNSTTRKISTDGFTLMTSSNYNNDRSTIYGINNASSSSYGVRTITETPPSKGGQIVPILYVDGFVDGYKYSVFVGGFAQTILSWKEDHTIKIKAVKAQNYLDVVPNVDTLLMRLVAVDVDNDDLGKDGGSLRKEGVIFRMMSSSSVRLLELFEGGRLFYVTLLVTVMYSLL